MKKVLLPAVFIFIAFCAKAQTTGSNNGSRQTGKPGAQIKKSTTQVRGSGQYHGSKDTTPGSPMGTGGAGGNEMSGSQTGSASESALQATKADSVGKGEMNTSGQTGTQGSRARKAGIKSKSGGSKNKRM